MKNRSLIILSTFLILMFIILGFEFKIGEDVHKIDKKKEKKPEIPQITKTNNFNIDLIKTTKRDSNYLISPYSIEIALNMLSVGANNNTKKQIEDVLPDRTINDVSIKNRVKIANALFVKDTYKNKITKEFSNTLVNNYNSEILYDKFSKPDVINNWVDKHTDGMIKKLLDYMDPDFVLGLANAIAIDVEWDTSFECNRTTEAEFTKQDNEKINVEMMHNNYDSSEYKYLKNEEATGIIIPYNTYNSKTGKADYNGDKNLEFVGILPSNDVSTYINNLTEDKLNNLFDSARSGSSKFEILLSLPRFKYSYEVPNFKEILINMGIKDAFSSEKADFTNIMKKDDMRNNLHVSEAIHKTYIDLNEKGTRAAAVTYFGLKDMAAPLQEEKETVSIKFNKPFIYMIRDSKTKEMLFFGVVYEPNIWKGSTCSKD